MYKIKQLLKKFTGNLLDRLLKYQSYQNYINDRYNKPGFSSINDMYLEDIFYTYKGFEFHIDDQIDSIHDVFSHYDASDIKPTDIVLDIGGNVGAFTMLAAKKAQHVYVVEPLFSHIIRRNLLRNNITNVDVLEMGLGKGDTKIRYGKFCKIVKCYTLPEIIDFTIGKHIDFLKIDCEGGEWCIKPNELKGIRRIEGEIHNLDGKHNVRTFNKIVEQAGFDCNYQDLDDIIEIIHCKRNLILKEQK